MTFAEGFTDTPPLKRRTVGKRVAAGATERQIQRSIVARLTMHGAYCHHSPNGGSRASRERLALWRDGARSGFPDLAVFGRGRCVLIEVKAPGGVLSIDQQECHAILAERGFHVAVVTDQEQAVAAAVEAGVIKA